MNNEICSTVNKKEDTSIHFVANAYPAHVLLTYADGKPERPYTSKKKQIEVPLPLIAAFLA